MSASPPHIAVDRIIPVFLGRDMEFVLARIHPNPPARFLMVDESEGETDSSDADKPTMEIVGRLRLGPTEAAEAAMGILNLLVSTQEIDLDELSTFTSRLEARAKRTNEDLAEGES